MRADKHPAATHSFKSKRLSEGSRGESREESNELLFGGSVLRERLRHRPSVFLRLHTTGHVCATFAFAGLLARCVRQDARCRRKPQWRGKQRQHHCN